MCGRMPHGCQAVRLEQTRLDRAGPHETAARAAVGLPAGAAHLISWATCRGREESRACGSSLSTEGWSQTQMARKEQGSEGAVCDRGHLHGLRPGTHTHH